MQSLTERTPIGNHISVCICTYKRPGLLINLLEKLEQQVTNDLFTYSAVIVDNDVNESAKAVVEVFKQKSSFNIDYFVEPEQNIALARNKAVESAYGDYIAFIDDDEFPEQDWLLNLYRAVHEFSADGILGPVTPCFVTDPPPWVVKGKLCELESFQTGAVIHSYRYTRTGNVLLDKGLFNDKACLFDSLLGKSGGEDVDFFRRMMLKGHKLVWCNEAAVREVVPKERLKRSYFLKRALLQGVVSSRNLSLFSFAAIKSVTAFFVYTSTLPVLLLLSHSLFMRYLIKDCNHIGRILALCRVKILKVRTW